MKEEDGSGNVRLERQVRRGTKDYAYWLADKTPGFGDYGKDCADCLREQADRIERLEYLVACNIDPMDCTDEDAALVRETHRTAFPENYRNA